MLPAASRNASQAPQKSKYENLAAEGDGVGDRDGVTLFVDDRDVEGDTVGVREGEGAHPKVAFTVAAPSTADVSNSTVEEK